MKFPRRQFLHLAAGAGALLVALRVVRADTYPSRPVRFIVGFPAGNASDVLARLMGQGLSDRFAQKLVVENRPGAGSNVGTELVVRAPPDGYTLLLITPSNALNKTLYEKLNFDFVNDIAPIASICQNPYVMAVTPSFQAKTVPEFIAYASPIQARSTWRLPVLEPRPMSSANCSRRRPASIWPMSPIVGTSYPICSAARYRSYLLR
jgi:tripartite-type tricarboxylate transporter receptor subunit TctC